MNALNEPRAVVHLHSPSTSAPRPTVPGPAAAVSSDGQAVRSASNQSAAAAPVVSPPYKAEIRGLSFYYGSFQALKNINLHIADKKVTALIGPSGCGKSTLLRCFNRIHDLYRGNRYEGEIILQPTGANIISRAVDPIEMRMRIGMVFQKPNPFPKSIFENVAYGLRLKGCRNRGELYGRVEDALQRAAIWDEVKDRLDKAAYDLSGGQQQRLCIARALAVDPEMLLFDEPTSALDPVATSYIEELIRSLRDKVTILIVTHNMAQAARVSDYTAFMYVGELAEIGKTVQLFENPQNKLTEEYITGRFG
jgi:phosphate transport system ATP-binding protein